MKLSARERTALRAMVEYAARYGEGAVPLHEVARAQGLPLPYLERVVAYLRRSGLLESVRGAHGGYLLTRRPEEISVADVFRAVEGSLMHLDCLGEQATNCTREAVCATRNVWRLVYSRLDDTLHSISLADVIAEPLVEGSEGIADDVQHPA